MSPFNVFFDDVNDWGIKCLERAIEGLKCETAVHICYGYGIKANTDWKQTQVNGVNTKKCFQNYKNRISILFRWSVTTLRTIELLELIRGKKVMVGAIDVAATDIETPDEVAATLQLSNM